MTIKWSKRIVLFYDIVVYLLVLYILTISGLKGQAYFVTLYFSYGLFICLFTIAGTFRKSVKWTIPWRIIILWPYLFVPSKTNEAIYVKSWVSHNNSIFTR